MVVASDPPGRPQIWRDRSGDQPYSAVLRLDLCVRVDAGRFGVGFRVLQYLTFNIIVHILLIILLLFLTYFNNCLKSR